MKSRTKITSIMMLFAMVFSLVPAATLPLQVSAATCFQAQFLADVTVPDGTTYSPDTTFKKTWKLKNIGTCAWSKTDVSLVFDTGAVMGATAPVALESEVAV